MTDYFLGFFIQSYHHLLIHDKDNGIYFEYEGEWLESLLPAIAMGDNSYDVFHSLPARNL
jgi:hypothetical protein